MADHSQMRLGKLPPADNSNLRKLKAYLPKEQQPIPAVLEDYKKVSSWPMMANDRLGDCTIASVGHCIQLWTALAQDAAIIFSDDVIVEAYSAITGYSPNIPNSDNGAVEIDVLKYWQSNGINNHKLAGFVALDHKNHYELQLANFLFGAVYVGVSLPRTAQNQEVWDVTHALFNCPDPDATPGSWGGHAVPIVGYNSVGPVCITWGATKQMTWAWWDKYGEEAYAILSQDWTNAQKQAPNHITWDELTVDLKTDFA